MAVGIPHCRDVTTDFKAMRGALHRAAPRRPATPPTAVAAGAAGAMVGSEHDALWQSLQLEATAISDTLKLLKERLREAAKPRLLGEECQQRVCDRLAEQAQKRFEGYRGALGTLQRCLATATRPEDRECLESMRQRATSQLADLLADYQRMLSEHARAKRRQARVAADVRQKLSGNKANKGISSDEEEEEELRLKYMERGLTPEQASRLALEEALANERGAEIQEVLRRLAEVGEMFREVQQLVQQQGLQLDRIDANIAETRESVTLAHGEIKKARDHQTGCVVM